ncbi:unnamed protein product [Penicillium salamii]|nr:unnamed protein product [Penicillium salamii]CAG8395182.1 unnamed protein product [Penicillium salamii]
MDRCSLVSSYSLWRFGNRRAKVGPVGPKKYTTLWKIPSGIVETIFQLLSDLDRACFALSCKRFHDYYVSYNKKRGISVPSTLPRTLLLRRLQNARWVYCIRCQNLHRRSKLQFLKSGWGCDPKPVVSKCNSWCDIQHDDKVDICPCSTVTFHQKQHPVEYFKSQKLTLRRASYEKASGWFMHLCIVEHPLARVSVQTQAHFNKMTNTFQVENQFAFKPSKEARTSSLFQNISFKLSRYETESWLKRFFHEAGSDFFIGNESSNWYQCHGWKIGEGEQGDTFNIILHRDLGGDRRPCKGWEDNCHT